MTELVSLAFIHISMRNFVASLLNFSVWITMTWTFSFFITIGAGTRVMGGRVGMLALSTFLLAKREKSFSLSASSSSGNSVSMVVLISSSIVHAFE